MLEIVSTKEQRGREIAADLGKWAKEAKVSRSREVGGKPTLGKDWRKDMKPKHDCFLCNELHWARDCPKRRSLIAMLEAQEREEQACMGSLQLLGAIEAKPTASTQGDKGLMYVEGKVDGEATQVMVDTRASHNFINAEEAKSVGLNLDGGQGLMKVENIKVKPEDGMVQGVELHLGEWREKVNDYGVVVEMTNRQAAKKVLSTMQVKEDLAKGEATYQAILQGEGGKRPKRLPPGGKVDHKKKHSWSMRPCINYRAPNNNGATEAWQANKNRHHQESKVEDWVKGKGLPESKEDALWRFKGANTKTSRKETRRGRREHRWGRISRPANLTRLSCPTRGNVKKKRLLEWLGSSWKT